MEVQGEITYYFPVGSLYLYISILLILLLLQLQYPLFHTALSLLWSNQIISSYNLLPLVDFLPPWQHQKTSRQFSLQSNLSAYILAHFLLNIIMSLTQ